jgi:hypothetical protein
MALQLIQQQQHVQKKTRSLNKKERVALKVEQKRAKVQMELHEVEAGF